jgi:predicted alpha/beta hydrolase family esterase
MGMNIGTVPVIHFAINSQENYNIKGIILISPIQIQKNDNEDDDDVYKYDNLKNIIVPIFIIHGKSDYIVSYKKSQELSNVLRCFSWFPENGTHTKTIQLCRKKFLYKI